MTTVSVVVPAYNEGPGIVSRLGAIEAVVRPLAVSYELVVVDDASEDDTTAALAVYVASNPAVRLLRNARNRGKGYSVRRGCLAAANETVAMVDADADLSLASLPLALDLVETDGYDVVIGSKGHPASTVGYPLKRRVLSLGYATLVRGLFDLGVADTQTGLKVFSRRVVESVVRHIETEGFAFDVELLVRARACGLRVAEVPIDLQYRGRSTVRWPHIDEMFQDTVDIYRRLGRPGWRQPALRGGLSLDGVGPVRTPIVAADSVDATSDMPPSSERT